MGQRLNVELTDNGDVLANAYYHWSGYTSSSIRIAKDIIDQLKASPDSDDLRLQAINLLGSTGAGLTTDEMEAAVKLYPDVDLPIASDRNSGLMAITEKGIEETRNWEEARVTIDIRHNIVDFEVWYRMEDKEFIEEWEGDVNNLTELDLELHELGFDDFEKLAEFAQENSEFRVKGEEGMVYSFIE